MKRLLVFVATLFLWSLGQARSQELQVPHKWGVYVADVSTGQVRLMGDFYDWKASPDGRFIAGGRSVGSKTDFYEVLVISTSTRTARRLERFPVFEPGGASFHWLSDSARVRVTADRNDDGKDEIKNFDVGKSSRHPMVTHRERRLGAATRKKLMRRFAEVEDVAFSPDGTRVVAYLSRGSYQDRKFDGGYWLFRPDGSGLRRLTWNTTFAQGDFDDREVVWLDGKRLAFRRTSFEDEGI